MRDQAPCRSSDRNRTRDRERQMKTKLTKTERVPQSQKDKGKGRCISRDRQTDRGERDGETETRRPRKSQGQTGTKGCGVPETERDVLWMETRCETGIKRRLPIGSQGSRTRRSGRQKPRRRKGWRQLR